MSLLNSVANKEVLDFLRTLTIKSTYFADRSRMIHVNSNLVDRVPETALPYIIHLAGEYIINDSNNARSLSDRFDGYRLTRDTTVNQFKNYWRASEDGKIISRLLPNEIALIHNPQEEGLYELKPFTIEGIINPVSHLPETYEFPVSQMIYGADDVVVSASASRVDRVAGFLNTEVKNSDLYYPAVFDEMMYVTSLDTHQEIPFCLEAFYTDAALAAGLSETSIHRKTLEAYRIPGRYFDLLCKRYPRQVDLIKAIVYRVPNEKIMRLMKITSMVTDPELKTRLQNRLKQGLVTEAYINDLVRRYPSQVEFLKTMGSDIDGSRTTDEMSLREQYRTVIAKADNFQLLAYDDERLDESEKINIREYLEQILNVFKTRWAIDEYNFEENYAAVLWSVLWSILPLALVARRYANIKTPSACLSHMWDYLNSKGLNNYRGYLTDKETWFLYKNIDYIFQHQAQQKTLDILIDNILTDYGLTLKAKTVVLDTTNSLKKDEKPILPKHQCESCARNGVSCFRNNTEHLCDEWLGTKHLCKAQPVVLTEKFAGATKDQIIRALKKSYGYDDLAAEFKYRRSFIWKDEDIEKIRDDLNRDQMVDINAPTESLEETLNAEHSSGQEPVVNDLVLQEQTKQLQHMNGTYAPTKLLVMYKKNYNVKYSELFNRFITETFLRLAPSVDGIKKVVCQYHFDTTESATSFLFDYGELLAAGYLGFVRENVVDAVVDDIVKDSKGQPLYELDPDESGKPVIIDYDSKGNPIYRKRLKKWIQKRFTDALNNPNYKFDIPDKCRTTTAFKFGKPVLQEELADEWMKQSRVMPTEEQKKLLAQVTNADENTQILTIRNIVYAVTINKDPTKDEQIVWEHFPNCLKILGEFTTTRKGEMTDWTFYENDDEIPLIPKFFRWYHAHLNPALDTPEEEKAKMIVNVRMAMNPVREGDRVIGYESNEIHIDQTNDTDKGFVTNPVTKEPVPQTGKLYFDESRNQNYYEFQMKQFLNLDNLLDRWVDLTGIITDQQVITNYIDATFEILEDIYTFATVTGNIRTSVACDLFLSNVITQKEIRFKLTDTEAKHDNTEGGVSAWFEDWLSTDEELMGSIRIIEQLRDSAIGWNEFNVSVLQQLIGGCSIQYAQEMINRSQYQKLKELVMSLSSYRITVVDNDEVSRVCNITATPIEDTLLDDFSGNEVIFFSPIGDAIAPPHVGGYAVNAGDDGFIMVHTSDLRLQSKTYYTLTVKDSDTYGSEDPQQILHLKNRPLAHDDDKGVTPEGAELPVKCEMINIPDFKEFQPYALSKDRFILKDKTYYKINPISGLFVKADVKDYVTKKVSEVTEEIPDNALRGTDESGNEIVYLTRDIYEPMKIGDRLPVGKCFEKINLYDILGIEVGTPLLIGKIDTKWYYATGTLTPTTLTIPCSAAEMSEPGFDMEKYKRGDSFDLKTGFSNEANKQYFDSVVYRLNVPVELVKWNDPVKSELLERVLYPTINREFALWESIEPLAELVEESKSGE